MQYILQGNLSVPQARHTLFAFYSCASKDAEPLQLYLPYQQEEDMPPALHQQQDGQIDLHHLNQYQHITEALTI